MTSDTDKKKVLSDGEVGVSLDERSLFRQSLDRCLSERVPRCGGCLPPKMTIRLLGSFVLVSGVMVSFAEVSLLVREEKRYQRCLLHQMGLVGTRFQDEPPDVGDAQDLLECYPQSINLVRATAALGVILLVMLIFFTMMMFVAVAAERWKLTLPWAYGCILVILHEFILVTGCWDLLGRGDIFIYTIHIILLAYSSVGMLAVLKMVRKGDFNTDEEGEP